MAHVVGVPKRDPCGKCELPVFLAERLMVGKRVYHRTCLKCARCGYQLTPGSFYETEIDEQYCCETCPDEEAYTNGPEQLGLYGDIIATNSLNVELRNTVMSETNESDSPVRPVRSSIKERLAFFENHRDDGESKKKLWQKSLSDEEKSKSLQRIDSSLRTVDSSYTPNVSLSNILSTTVDSKEVLTEPSLPIQKSKMKTSHSDDDTDDLTKASLPPELPESLPPLKELNFENKLEGRKRFSVSTAFELTSSPIAGTSEKTDEHSIFGKRSLKENQSCELKINLSPTAIDEEHLSATAEQQIKKERVQLHSIKLKNNLEFSETNDNDCVTKDNSADEMRIMQTTAEDPQQLMDRKDTSNTDGKQSDESKTIENNDPIEGNMDEPSNISSQLGNNKSDEALIASCARLHQFEVITINENVEEEKEKSLKQSLENVIESEDINKVEKFSLELIENETEIDGKSTLFNKTVLKSEPICLKNDDKVPLTNKTKDNERIESNVDNKRVQLKNDLEANISNVQTPQTNNSKTNIEEYPGDLNPFNSDEDDEILKNNKENLEIKRINTVSPKNENLNPFDSSDDEVELEKAQKSQTLINSTTKVPPPRPPPPRISQNPFGGEDEEEASTQNFRRSSLTGSHNRKAPVPTPRSNISQSQNPTPEATPRLSTKVSTTTLNNSSLPILQNSSEFYGSVNSLYSNNTTSYNISRNSDVRSSNNSLNLSAGGTIRSRKSRRAPLPPAPVRELFPSNESINSSSKTSTPTSSTVGTPKSARKKRPAPAPPKPARLETPQVPQIHFDTVSTHSKNLDNYPLQCELNSKLSDEEKALLEGKTLQSLHSEESDLSQSQSSRTNSKRLIPLDKELLEEHGSLQYGKESDCQCDDLKQHNQQKSPTVHEDEISVVYRRILIPQNLETPTREHNPLIEDLNKSSPLGERQMEKIKDNKEANNRNRQSQISVTSSGADDNDPLYNKSVHGKWKRRKGPAPALPIPPRKVLQMLPLQEIKHELEIIEVQQQGLEKQGVILEKMIRDRCEGENGEPLNTNGLPGGSVEYASGSSTAENSKEVENLILQLFELVNEKNELFRRQAELMYLRRQHRLEQEQADLEYEIRTLMAQPERNKTDSDKTREEALIERLVEVVQLRNEVIECLEMDRLREAEEDQSIKQRLESHIAKREENFNIEKTLTKLSKKEKKKQKESKKLFKSKKLDADKDADESELNVDKVKSKKKKKLLIF